MADRGLQGDAGSRAVAEEIRAFDFELPEEGGCVVRHLSVGQRPIDVGGVAVSMLLDGDDLPGLRKQR